MTFCLHTHIEQILHNKKMYALLKNCNFTNILNTIDFRI